MVRITVEPVGGGWRLVAAAEIVAVAAAAMMVVAVGMGTRAVATALSGTAWHYPSKQREWK